MNHKTEEKKEVEIQATKNVWIVWTNTDRTEGRGLQIPMAFCDIEATAIRLGKKGYVQGNDCPISEAVAVKIKNSWLVPGRIEPEGPMDRAAQMLLDKKRAAFEKALDAGLTHDELKLIGSNNI